MNNHIVCYTLSLSVLIMKNECEDELGLKSIIKFYTVYNFIFMVWEYTIIKEQCNHKMKDLHAWQVYKINNSATT